MTIRRSIIIAASLIAFAASADASFAAASATTKECSNQWAKMKADNNVPSGMTWPKFLSQCSKDIAASSDQPAAAPTKNATKASATKMAAKADTVDEDDSASSAADKKACDAKWGTYKASKGVHGWKAYFTFMAGCM
jgi:hypothetical protein